MQARSDPSADPSLPPGDGQLAGFRLARICNLEELEAGAYWPRLQPHFLKPHFRRLRYRIEESPGDGRAAARPFSVRGASGIGEMDVAYIADRLAATLGIADGGIPDYCLTDVSRGSLDYAAAPGRREALTVDGNAGLVYRGTPGTTLAATGDHERLAVWIPVATLNQRLSALLDGPVTKELAFEPVFDWNAAPGLRRLLRLLVAELGSTGSFAGSEVASRSFTDLVLYTLLRTVPHNHSERLARPGGSAAPGIVRRAEAYIRAHLEEPIALHEVAAAAGCSVRSLQLGFQRFRGTTPLSAIRDARLEAARDALHAGAEGCTITDLALRFGFTNPGRFARIYRAAFGEAPHDTLHRSPLGGRRGG
jgi:AraC-like DNA-binding protein